MNEMFFPLNIKSAILEEIAEIIENAVEYVEMSMRLRPKWGMDLPLNCESGYGLTYGDC